MIIKFKRGAAHLGYAYRAGSVATSLPDKDAKYLVEAGIAEDITPKPKSEKTKKPRRAKVETAVVNKKK